MEHDILIIGGGPAGLTAALYARRANKSVLVTEKGAFGGQITFSPKVENIPGFVSLSGNEFADKLVEQVLAAGADMEPCEVTGVEKTGDIFTVHTDGGDFTARSVIVATGARHRMLGLAGEESLVGNGISFCAVCDGAFFADKRVGVVGGGNSALQEALLLSDLCREVTVIQNLPTLTGEAALCRQLEEKKNVRICTETVVCAVLGDGKLTGVRTQHTDDGFRGTGVQTELPLDGLFIAIGLLPQNEPFAALVALDERGYAKAGEDCRTETRGLYVAGDCRGKRIRQVTTAAADGAVAALAAIDYLDGRG